MSSDNIVRLFKIHTNLSTDMSLERIDMSDSDDDDDDPLNWVRTSASEDDESLVTHVRGAVT